VTLDPLAPDLWSLDHVARLPGGVQMPVRMTVVRLPGRALVLHSPVPIDDAAAASLAGLGDVAHIIAPNRFHHVWLDAAAERYPGAALWLAPGLAERHPALTVAGTLGDDPPAAWRDHLTPIFLAGAPRISETVFFHTVTGTLVCADLVFHIERPPNLRTRLLLAATGTGGGRLAASRIWRLATRDRAALSASLARIIALTPRRIVMSHGTPFEGDVAAALRATRLP